VEISGHSALHVAQDVLDQRKVGGSCMKRRHLLDGVGELGTGECQVL
jgi:hypothetical protein